MEFISWWDLWLLEKKYFYCDVAVGINFNLFEVKNIIPCEHVDRDHPSA